MNADNINLYDSFLKDLAREMDERPDKKLEIVTNAVKKTTCPYLKDQIRLLDCMKELRMMEVGKN